MEPSTCYWDNSTAFNFDFCPSGFCFSVPNADQQVNCSARNLNIYEPPSTYDYEHYTELWEPVTCLLFNVTYHLRHNLQDTFNFCAVPLSGADAFLFVSLALLAACVLFGKLSAVWVLVAGGVLGLVNYHVNMLELSNAIALWIGIQPPDLFFYAFLPPLLVDSAIRIDFFMFRKLWVHIVMMAFVMVVLSAIILTPLILFVLGFSSRGWSWVHGALFAAMIASTDALAAAAILKGGGGPERLVVLMEGEALLNDASAITLFEVFMHILEEHKTPEVPWPSVWSVMPTILREIAKLAGIGAGIGLAFSIVTTYLLRWLRWRGAKPYIETTVVLAMAYLSFYVTNSPAKGSGVIAVVVFGLYGNATSKWGMLASAEESGAFDATWDTISFGANGLVFFWAGVACVNFFERSVDALGYTAWSYAAIPCIYVFMMFIRGGCLAAFNPLFKLLKEPLNTKEIVFTTWSGLRGAVSLIMIADFVVISNFQMGDASNPDDPYRELDVVNADICLWTSAFVLLTLCLNAPSISTVLNILKLNRIPPEKLKMRSKAKRALLRFTNAAIGNLREDDHEFLQGANWEAVAQYVDMSDKLPRFDPPPDGAEPPPDKPGMLLARCMALFKRSKGAGDAAALGETNLTWGDKLRTYRRHMRDSTGEHLPPGAQPQQEHQERNRATSDGEEGVAAGVDEGAGSPFSEGQGGGAGATSPGWGDKSSVGTGPAPFASPLRTRSSAAYDSDVETDSDSFTTASQDTFSMRNRSQWPSLEGPHNQGRASVRDPQELSHLLQECPFLKATPSSANLAALVAAQASPTASPKGTVDIEMGLAGARTPAAGSSTAPGPGAPTGDLSKAPLAFGTALASAAHSTTAVAAAAGAAFTAAASAAGDLLPTFAGPPPPVRLSSSSGVEQPSVGALESITEGQQLDLGMERGSGLVAVGSRGSVGPSQEEREKDLPPPSPSAHAAAALSALGDPSVDYYSSMPAATGRLLQRQLAEQLRAGSAKGLAGGAAGDTAVASGPGVAAAGATGAVVPEGAEHGVAGAAGTAGAAAPALGPQLLQSESPHSQGSGGGPFDDSGGYYSSMPAVVGRQMQARLAAQLKAELAAQQAQRWAQGQSEGGPEREGSEAPSSPWRRATEPQRPPKGQLLSLGGAGVGGAQELNGAPEEAGSVEGYYSSLPVKAGQSLALQLKQQLASLQQQQGPAQQSKGAESSPPQQAQRSGSELPSSADQDLPQGYYSSLPAEAGRQLQAQLAAQLAAARAASTSSTPAARAAPAESDSDAPSSSTATPRPPRPASGARRPPLPHVASGGDMHTGYYASLPAEAGRQLQTALQAQLAAARAAQQAQRGQEGQEQQQQGGQPRGEEAPSPSDSGDERSSGPPSGRKGGPGDIHHVPSDSDMPVEFSTHLPPNARQSLQAALQAKLRQQRSGKQEGPSLPRRLGASPLGSAPLSPPSPAAEADAAGPAAGPEPSAGSDSRPRAARALPLDTAAAAGAAAAATPGPSDHFSTMPAAVGQRLQMELQRELALEKLKQAQAEASRGQGAVGQQAARGTGAGLPPPPEWDASKAGPARPPKPLGVSHHHPQQQPSARRLAPWQHAKPRLSAGAPAATATAAVTPAAASTPGSRRSTVDHYATVSGVAGSSLALELRRQLGSSVVRQASTPGGAAPLQRDLLGRKLPSSGSAAATPRLPADKHPLSRTTTRAHQRKPSDGSLHSAIVPASTLVADALTRVRPRGASAGKAGKAVDAAALAGATGAGSLSPRGGWSSSQDAFRHHSRAEAGGMRSVDRAWQHRRSTAGSSAAGATAAGGAPLSAGATPLRPRTYPITVGSKPNLEHVSPHMHNKAGSMVGEGSYHGSSPRYKPHAHEPPHFEDPEGQEQFESKSDPEAGMSPQALAEMRSRLVGGLKRYFHAKRVAGLLSVKGMRILEYACETAIEHCDQPLGMWARLEAEIRGNWATRAAARVLRGLVTGFFWLPGWAQTLLHWPTQSLSGVLRGLLGRELLVACEVSVEYYLALLHSPQVQWMRSTDEAWPLQAEVEGEVEAAYHFIIGREIEAPDRFQAIQSYRAAMAVIRQQLTFVQELFDTGMVDQGECEYMQGPLDKKMRHLEIVGPVWRPPKPREVLRSMPFMQGVPSHIFNLVFREGEITDWQSGRVLWQSTNLVRETGLEQGPGAFVVLSGVVKRTYIKPDGTKKEYFQGIGGTVGVLLAVTGTRLPGSEVAVAEGNTLGRGPIVFHIPQTSISKLRRLAQSGDAGAKLLECQLVRLCALYVVECLEPTLVAAVEEFLLGLAAAKAARALRRKGKSGATASPRARRATVPQAGSSAKGGGATLVGLGRSWSGLGEFEGRARGASAGGEVAGRPSLRGEEGGLAGRGMQLSNLMQMIAQLEFEELDQAHSHLAPYAEGDEETTDLQGASSSSFGRQLGRGGEGVQSSSSSDKLASGGGSFRQQGQRDSSAGTDIDGVATIRKAASTTHRELSSEAAAEPGQGQASASAAAGTKGVKWGDNWDGEGGGQRHLQGGALAGKKAARYLRAKSRTAVRKAPMYAAEVAADLGRGVSAAQVFELPPGATWRQVSHGVLLRGALQEAALDRGPATAQQQQDNDQEQHQQIGGQPQLLQQRSNTGVAQQAQQAALPLHSLVAPAIVPWLWTPGLRCNAGARSLAPPYTKWMAGEEGATLVVWLPETGEPPPVEVASKLPPAARPSVMRTMSVRPSAAATTTPTPAAVPAAVPQEQGGGPGQSSAAVAAGGAAWVGAQQAQQQGSDGLDTSPLRPGLRRIRTPHNGGMAASAALHPSQGEDGIM